MVQIFIGAIIAHIRYPIVMFMLLDMHNNDSGGGARWLAAEMTFKQH